MGKTSAKVKNRYNEKTYDRIPLVVKKGYASVISAHAKSKNESRNAFILRAIDEQIKQDKTN